MRRYRREIVTCLALAGLTLFAYLPVLSCGFVNFDDNYYVTSNAHVQAGLSTAGLRWAFGTVHAANWHPLTWLSLQLDATLFGTRPLGFHVTNLVLHVTSTLLLFLFLRSATASPWASALTAGLFAVHPLHVESVAWVSERKDVLSGLFWMLTLLCYAWFVRRRNAWRYALLLVVFASGLMAKPMLVTLPCVLLLLDYWPLQRREGPGRLLWEKVPLFGLALASCAVTVYAQSQGGAVVTLDELPPADRLANAVLSYGRYLEKMVLIHRLAPYYPFPDQDHLLLPALLSGLMLLGITGVVVYLRGGRPHLLVGWLWYLGTLVPVIGLAQVGVQAMADRYTYLPLIGVFIMVAWEAVRWSERGRYTRAAGGLAAAVVLLLCTIGTRSQVRIWQDSRSLWEHTLAVVGPDPQAYLYLGQFLAREGRQDEAFQNYREAVRRAPRWDMARVNLARALQRRGQLREATEHIREALRLNPRSAQAQVVFAEILSESGETDEALRRLRQALALEPDFAPSHNLLGIILDKQGRQDEAMAEYRLARALDPGNAATLINLGKAQEQRGQPEEALRSYQEALRIDPAAEMAHVNLGVLLDRKQQAAQAEAHFRQALEINPRSAKAHYNLGTSLGKQGKLERAITHLDQAVKLDPNYALAHFNLGFALQESGQFEAALGHLQCAFRLEPKSTQYRLAVVYMLRRLGRAEEAEALEGKPPPSVPR